MLLKNIIFHSPCLFQHCPSTPSILSSFTIWSSFLTSLHFFLCSFRCSLGSEETREVSQFLYIDPFIFNGPMFPRVGAILCRFRWAGDAVRACCHSVLLRAKAHDLGSALTAIPGEPDVPISPLSNTEDKLKIPDGL